ncbi:MAG: hypothetical protein LAP38_03775 [Acidobacteriia bacterium]|nr:hypothetical protein [Terriglobia bacterium]
MARATPVALIVMLSLSACIPIPHHTDVAIAKGGERKTPKIEFLKEGITTKAEVLEELGSVDTGASEGRLFWGRWEQTKFQIDYPPTVLQDAIWRRINLLAVFDAGDLLLQYCLCSDAQLLACLHRMLDHLDAPADASSRLRLSAMRQRALWPVDGEAVFENGTLAFLVGDKPDFVVPFSAIADVVNGGYLGYPDWSVVSLTVHFKPHTAPTDHLVLRTSPKETLRLIWLLR